MHCFGIPRRTKSMIHYTLYFWEFQSKIAGKIYSQVDGGLYARMMPPSNVLAWLTKPRTRGRPTYIYLFFYLDLAIRLYSRLVVHTNNAITLQYLLVLPSICQGDNQLVG